jgi:hypothetical protein
MLLSEVIAAETLRARILKIVQEAIHFLYVAPQLLSHVLHYKLDLLVTIVAQAEIRTRVGNMEERKHYGLSSAVLGWIVNDFRVF